MSVRNSPPGVELALAIVLAFGTVAAVQAQDNESYHYLEELKLRVGLKPYERMLADGFYPSERTVFPDSVTGVETWKMTRDPAVVRHEDYDLPVWSRDGTHMLISHAGGVSPNPNWLVLADGSALWPLPTPTVVDLKWSWHDNDVMYGLSGSEIVRVTWPTWTVESLFDFDSVIPPIDTERVLQVGTHPLDDRLLLHTNELGRFFSFDVDLREFNEIPTDGRWAVLDGIHRLRWTKDADHNAFFGQNWRLLDGQPFFDRRQYIVPLTGAFEPLDECMLPGVDDRAGHPDLTMNGLAVTGTIDRNFWIHYCNGEQPSRILFPVEEPHHGSVLFDNRWHVVDNEDGLSYEVGGLNVSDSNLLFSLDGRAQMVLNYHYSLQADLITYTEPRSSSSPDGTKIVYDSNVMNRGLPGAEGTSDVYVAIVRRPFPPTDVNAAAGPGEVRLSWSRPLHSPAEIHWNPGNLSREISGYHVWRAESSGGPYAQITDAPVVATEYADVSVVPDTFYYYVVQSVEPSGLGSVFSEEDAASTAGSQWQGLVRHHYQAELAELELPLVPQLAPGEASGGWFAGTFALEPDPAFPLESLPTAINLGVRAPIGSAYTLWLRVRAFNGAAGSFDVELDGVPQGSVGFDQDEWLWVALAGSMSMPKGDHTVSIATSDLQVGLDQIALTNDGAYVPVGIAGVDLEAPAPPSNTRLVAVDATTKKLIWDPSPDNDVQYYNVYCGRDDAYALANPNRLYSPVEPVAWDWGIPAAMPTVYKITAVDRFGNESVPVVHDPAVSGEGSAPVSVADVYTVDEDTLLAPGGLGVLDNDQDLDGDVLSAILVQDVVNGTLDLFSDGSFTYTPGSEFSGQDTFVYKASDGLAESLEATVTITVEAVNDPPDTLADAYSINEDKLLTRSPMNGVLANDTDVEEEPLIAQLVTDVTDGTLTLHEDGSFEYDPEPDFNGSDSFTYEAFDGTDPSAVTQVTITVVPIDDSPEAIDDAYSVLEDGELAVTAPGVLANDVEVDGEPLTAVLDSGVQNGTLVLDPDGRFTYTPFPNFEGTDRFHYRANDGIGDSNAAVVTITVDSVNDVPVAVDDAYSGEEDRAMVVSAGVLGNDTDADDGNLDAVLLSEPDRGLLLFDGASGDFVFYPDANWNGSTEFTYSATDGEDLSAPARVVLTIDPVNDTARVRSRGYTIDEDEVLSLPAPGLLVRIVDPDGDPITAVLEQDVNRGTLVLRPDGSLDYTPDANDTGEMYFRFRVDDGFELSNAALVRIDVLSIPDAPVGVPDSYLTTEDTELAVPIPSGVLVNDSDGDGDSITAELLSGPAHGSLDAFAVSGRFNYTPGDGFVGEDTFTYRATDGVLDSGPVTVTITVQAATTPATQRSADR